VRRRRWVVTYAHEMENTKVRVNLVNPGPTRTAMRAKAFPGEDPLSLKAPEDVTPTFVRLASAIRGQRPRLRPQDRRGALRTALLSSRNFAKRNVGQRTIWVGSRANATAGMTVVPSLAPRRQR
jgi:NAD(P)-dependent dehydrogenase (short-subunit alcohol dehydrogenase family)